MTETMEQGRGAATVVIVRDRDDGPCDILMVERSAKMAFAAGALVFPGGGIDEADRALAAAWAGDLDVDEAAARIGGIRETLEESGLSVGLTGAIDPDGLAAMRRALHEGRALGDLLGEYGLGLALDRLVPFARWHPSASENARRVYDTRFYLVRAPQDQEASADATENVHLFWSPAADVIARCDNGEGHIIFPTRRNLERLAQFDSFDELVAHARSVPVEKVQPWIEEREGEHILCIPAHLGYPVTTEPMASVKRG